MALLHQEKIDEAISHLSEALRRMPEGFAEQYQPADMHYRLGRALLYKGNSKQAAVHLSEAVRLDPNHPQALYRLALSLADQGDFKRAIECYSKAVRLQPDVDTSPTLHYLLATNYAESRQFHEAVLSAQKALDLARSAGDKKLVQAISERLELYRQLDTQK
ncbi:MAG: hypothetical protein A2Z25_17070 [Planctomycetes bacterium RBG_16_55_9]|nr:MAG: hypothetical protein A2Z25_17070 [Planctomycetes bacterium RBG_16_55_9]